MLQMVLTVYFGTAWHSTKLFCWLSPALHFAVADPLCFVGVGPEGLVDPAGG